MTDNQIIFAARVVRDGGHWNQLDLLAFGRIIALAEREACAKLADEFHPPGKISVGHAIRARGEK
jgi:predicted thioesterase